MKRSFSNSYIILLFAYILICSNLKAQNTEEGLGEKLANDFWSHIKAGTIDSYADKISDGFLALHYYGAGNKTSEVELIKTIKLGEYKLSDFKESLSGNVIVVTYKVTADEELYGRKIEPSYRMTIWQNVDKVWLLTAHCVMSNPEN